jgi:hypothetical protein
MGLDSLFSFLGDSVKRCSHLKHDLDLFLFDNTERKDELAEMGNSLTGALPKINLAPTIFRHLSGSIFSPQTTKNGHKPIYQLGIRRRNLDESLVIFGSSFFIAAVIAYVNATFTVNNTGKIADLVRRIIFSFVKISHDKPPFVTYDVSIIQDKAIDVQPERLRRVDTEKSVKRQSELTGNCERDLRRGNPAINKNDGHKDLTILSNRMSYPRPRSSTLVGNGALGRLYALMLAHLKPLVIDLESRQADKGQAARACSLRD